MMGKETTREGKGAELLSTCKSQNEGAEPGWRRDLSSYDGVRDRENKHSATAQVKIN